VRREKKRTGSVDKGATVDHTAKAPATPPGSPKSKPKNDGAKTPPAAPKKVPTPK
jgi:hypothetical protein